MCTNVTHGADAWPGADVAPRGMSRARRTSATQSRRLLWRDGRAICRAMRGHQLRQSRWRG
jgi:hypothetical protein